MNVPNPPVIPDGLFVRHGCLEWMETVTSAEVSQNDKVAVVKKNIPLISDELRLNNQEIKSLLHTIPGWYPGAVCLE